MDNATLSILLAVIGSGALSSLIGGIFTAISTRKASNNRKDQALVSLERGVCALLYDRIKHLCERHIARGEISVDDYNDLIRLHITYHNDLNGNGFLDHLMEAVEQLPKVSHYSH